MRTVPGKDFLIRRACVALLLTFMAVDAAVAGAGIGWPVWPAGLAAWLAGALLWPQLTWHQQQQSLWIVGIGLGAFAAAVLLGAEPVWSNLLTQNAALLGMLVAVSFLQLLSPQAGKETDLPRGKMALWKTILGVHLLGSVINLSAVFIMADRIGPNGKPTRDQISALTRAFLAAAMWSPFFAATAVALTYAPGANPLHLAFVGSAFAGVLLMLNGRDIARRSGNDAAEFVGYPLLFSTLVVPGGLAVLVALGHWIFPGWATLSVISIASMSVVCLTAMYRQGMVKGLRSFAEQAEKRLPNMGGEVVLFLSAGTFASGLTALISAQGIWMPFNQFGVIEAAIVLAAMILLAFVGIHTVISIAMVATWLAPLHPDPLLLALVFVQSWSVGLATGPMSGINLAFQGRYGISSTLLAKANLTYCIQAYCLAVVCLAVVVGIKSFQP